MRDELPQSWATASISDVVDDFRPGFASGEKNVANGVPHLRMNNIGRRGDLVLDLMRTVPEKLVRSHHDLRRGDVLICTTNSSDLVGKCAFFDLPGRYVFSNHLTRLRPKHGVLDGSFLRWSVWLSWRRGLFHDKCKHWVNQSALPKDALLSTEVALSPLNEQRRIVAKLEKLLGKVDACQKRLAKIPVLLKRFRQSVLAGACSGRLTANWREQNKPDESGEGLLERVVRARRRWWIDNQKRKYVQPVSANVDQLESLPSSWTWGTWDQVSNWVTYGFTRPMPHVERGISIVTAKHVLPGNIKFSETEKTTREAFNELSEKDRPIVGDILITKDGSIGRAAIIDTSDPFCINQSVAVVWLRSSTLDRKFLLAAIQWPLTQNRIAEKARGAAIQHLSITDFAKMPLPVPPLAEQQEIVRRVEELFALAAQIETRYAKAKAHIDNLTQSILAKAFRGELVPQDPSDEPASVLLERIKQQQKAATHAKSSKRKHAHFASA